MPLGPKRDRAGFEKGPLGGNGLDLVPFWRRWPPIAARRYVRGKSVHAQETAQIFRHELGQDFVFVMWRKGNRYPDRGVFDHQAAFICA